MVTTTTDHSNVTQNKWTGKTCAIILVTLIAVFAIVVIAIFAAMVIFNPQTRESNSEIETLKQQIENLRTTVSQIQQSSVSSIQGNIREEILRQGIQEMD